MQLAAHLQLVNALGHTHVHHIRHVVGLNISVAHDEEDYGLLRAVLTRGGIADVLADAHHGHVVLQQFLVNLHPRPLATGRLVDDIDVAVVLVEVAAFHYLDAHRLQVVAVHGHAGEGDGVLVVAPAPAHIAVPGAQHEARVAHVAHAAQLHQLATHGLLLVHQLVVQDGAEHLVLLEAVAALVDETALQEQDADVAHHEQGDAQLQAHEHGAQPPALGRQSERAFQHQCGLERGGEEGGIGARRQPYAHGQRHHQGHCLPVVAQRQAALQQSGMLRCHRSTQQERQPAGQQRRDHALADEAQAQTAHALAQHATGVDALDAHGALGQREVEEVDGGNDDDEHAGQLQHEEHGGVALVAVGHAREVGLADGPQAEVLAAEVGFELPLELSLVGLHHVAAVQGVAHQLLHQLLLHLLAEVLQQRGAIHAREQLHEEVVAPLAQVFHGKGRRIIDVVLHRAVVGEVLVDAVHGERVGLVAERLPHGIYPSVELAGQRGGDECAFLAIVVPAEPSVEAAGSDGTEGRQVRARDLMLHLAVAHHDEPALRPAGQLAHGLHLRHLGDDGMHATVAVGAPRGLGVHLRLQPVDAVAVGDVPIVRAVVVHLRHQQVEGGEGHREARQVQRRGGLEAARHVPAVLQYVHCSALLKNATKVSRKSRTAKARGPDGSRLSKNYTLRCMIL